MPRDYARTKPRRKSNKTRNSSSAGLWINTGLLVLAFVAALVYLQRAPTPQQSRSIIAANNSHVSTRAIHTNGTTTAAKDQSNQAKSNKSKPQFDFYTILSGEKTLAVAPPKPGSGNQQPSLAPNTTVASPAATAAVVQTNNQPTQTEGKPVVLPPPPMLDLSKTEAPVAQVQADNSPATEVKNVLNTLPGAKKEKQNNNNVVLPLPGPTAQNNVRKKYLLQIASVSRFEEADRLKAQLTLLGFDVAVQTTKVGNRQWHRVNLGPYLSASAAKNMQKQLASKGVQSILVNTR